MLGRDLGSQRVDLAAEAPHLAPAELEDLVGTQAGRRRHPDGLAVHVAAAGYLGEAVRRPAPRDVLVLDEGAQLAVRRHDLALDRLEVPLRDAPPSGLVEARRKALERLVEGAGPRVLDDVRVELRHQLDHRVARLGDAARYSHPHVLDGGVDPDDEAVHPPQEVLVVPHGLERMRASTHAEDGEPGGPAAGLVDRQQVPRQPEALDAGVEAVLEDVVREELARAQRGAIDTAQILAVARAQ